MLTVVESHIYIWSKYFKNVDGENVRETLRKDEDK
jgi:hypothetical protein